MVMNKYKHKLTGKIAVQHKINSFYIENDIKDCSKEFPMWIIENSNDWEEVKEYLKIISFRRIKDSSYGGFIKGQIWNLQDDGNFLAEGTKYNKIKLETLINCSDHEIYQVQTPPDTIFTIGDKVVIDECNPSYHKGEIKYFQIANDGHIRVEVSNGCNVSVTKIKKAPKPLFTTEDGKEINIGDNYWVWDYGCLKGTNSEIHAVFNASCTHTGDGVNRKYFSTKEAAEQYIKQNKPRFSVKDIEDALTMNWGRTVGDMGNVLILAEESFRQKLGI